MLTSYIETLKEHVGFTRWCGRNAMPAGDVLLRGYASPSDLLPGWRLLRRQQFSARRLPSVERSVWQRENGDVGSTMKFNIYECSSRTAAHEFLVARLAQATSINAYGSGSIETLGDVLFASRSGLSLFFARANMVAFVAVIGGGDLPAGELAAVLDERLASRPQGPALVSAAASRVRLSRRPEGERDTPPHGARRVKLCFECSAVEPEAVLAPDLKFFCDSGRFVGGAAGQLEVEAPGSEVVVDAYLMGEGGAVHSQSIKLPAHDGEASGDS